MLIQSHGAAKPTALDLMIYFSNDNQVLSHQEHPVIRFDRDSCPADLQAYRKISAGYSRIAGRERTEMTKLFPNGSFVVWWEALCVLFAC